MEDMLEHSVLLQCRVNGKIVEEDINPATTLLDFIREDLGLTGTHMGCMTGHCGACTVMIDGRIAKSCITLAATVQRAKITTLEGVAPDAETLHPIQQAFWDEAGFQCAYCAPGMVLAAVELLEENSDPSDAEIRDAIAGNLCRCTGYQSIIRAIKTAAGNMRSEN